MVNNENKLDDLFSLAKSEPVLLSLKETKEQFTQSVNSIGTTGGKLAYSINLKLIGMITIVSALAVTALIYGGSTDSEPENKTPITSVILDKNNDSIKAIEETEKVIQDYYIETIEEQVAKDSNKVELTVLEEKNIESPRREFVMKIEEQTKKVQRFFEEPYRFPKLTEAEIKANNKQKEKMLKQIGRLGGKKSNFTYIPSGKYKEITIQSFLIQKTEVSNLEYRTFLFDLLIKDRKEDFLIAQPDQTKWTTEYPDGFNEPLQETYFSHPAYNEYPVVAISRKGAVMYCDWLTKEAIKKHGKGGKRIITKIRIPTEVEWKIAASGGEPNRKFAFNGESVMNENACYEANFNPERKASADGGMYTVKVWSYNPNPYGLFCMSGNAAEMIYYQNTNGITTPGTKGGSWNSIEKELEIEGIDRWKGRTEPSVNIGFRVVMTYLGGN